MHARGGADRSKKAAAPQASHVSACQPVWQPDQTGRKLLATYLALRQTEGLIGSALHLRGLPLAVPDHTTLCRRAETLEVPRPRQREEGEAAHLLVDSTGLKLCGAGEWLLEKHGTKTRRS